MELKYRSCIKIQKRNTFEKYIFFLMFPKNLFYMESLHVSLLLIVVAAPVFRRYGSDVVLSEAYTI